MKYLYRAVNALIAISILPIAFFMKMLYICVGTTDDLGSLIGTINETVNAGIKYNSIGLEESFSIKDLIDVFVTGNHYAYDLSEKSGEFVWPTALEPVDGRINAVVALFVATIVIALFVFFWSIFSNKRLPVVIASVAGAGTTVAMIACFNSAAAWITSGALKITDLLPKSTFSGMLGSIGSFFIDGMLEIAELKFDGMHLAFLFVFIGLICWTGAFYLVELGDNEEAKAKKH